MENQELTNIEFLLVLGKNIVIQRFFSVRNFNPKSKYSLELYELTRDICETISNDLKNRTLEHLNDLNRQYLEIEDAEDVKNLNPEYFTLEIKRDDDIFIKRIFPANIYHPKIRYTVDIRPKIRQILSDLTNVLSRNKLTYKYLNYSLIN